MNLGCYGDPVAKTPHLDELASRSLRFDRAYCQFASCNASRSSVITGQRPDSISVWKLNTNFRDTTPDAITLPQHFKTHGYHTEAIGKVLHNYYPKMRDNALSWSTPARLDKLSHFTDYALAKNVPQGGAKKSIITEEADVDDSAYVDGKIAADAVKTIHQLAAQDRPFFLAVGFMKPHSPYNAPQKYWDLYERSNLKALAPETRPKNMSELNWWDSGEIRTYDDVPTKGTIPRETAARMRHGYYAATSYLDANVGRVLKALKESGADARTIVVLWSDHGYHLGENGHWAKVTVRELDAQIPLLISVPGRAPAKTNAIFESVDLYPTLSDLCGLPAPTAIDGRSAIEVINDPSSEFRPAALTQVARPWAGENPIDTMGYSIRTPHYRYTQWRDHKTKAILSEELYQLDDDPFQRQNLAEDANLTQVLSTHRTLLNHEVPR
jgi:iduronate 2-sulfatase